MKYIYIYICLYSLLVHCRFLYIEILDQVCWIRQCMCLSSIWNLVDQTVFFLYLFLQFCCCHLVLPGQFSIQLISHDAIVMNITSWDKTRLPIISDQFILLWLQSVCYDVLDSFVNHVTETYQIKIQVSDRREQILEQT